MADTLWFWFTTLCKISILVWFSNKKSLKPHQKAQVRTKFSTSSALSRVKKRSIRAQLLPLGKASCSPNWQQGGDMFSSNSPVWSETPRGISSKTPRPQFLLLRLPLQAAEIAPNFFPPNVGSKPQLAGRENVPKFRQNCRDFPWLKKVARGPKTLIQVGEHTVAIALNLVGGFFKAIFSCLTRTLGK